MTISQIRRRIDALMRRSASELAIIRIRRIAEAVADGWDPDQTPESAAVIQRIVKAGCRLPIFVPLRRYLDNIRRQADVPDPESIVLRLLPWASGDDHSPKRLRARGMAGCRIRGAGL